jgi:hypothetical protein
MPTYIKILDEEEEVVPSERRYKLNGEYITPTCGVILVYSYDHKFEYIVGSSRIEITWRDYQKMLRDGTHKCKKLQEAYDKYCGGLQYKILTVCTPDRVKEYRHVWCQVYEQSHRPNTGMKYKKQRHLEYA